MAPAAAYEPAEHNAHGVAAFESVSAVPAAHLVQLLAAALE